MVTLSTGEKMVPWPKSFFCSEPSEINAGHAFDFSICRTGRKANGAAGHTSASLRTAGKVGLRKFGIALRAVWTAGTKEHADQVLRPTLRQLKRCGPFPQPVCLFFFTMEDDGAWYTWVAEPAIEDGKPVLRSGDDADCRLLDKRALNEIIERVDGWYDALFASLVVNEPGWRNAMPT